MNNLVRNVPLRMTEYVSAEEKLKKFRRSRTYPENRIDTFKQFNNWYKYWSKINETKKYRAYFRGMGEAKYKLYNSAQRLWNMYNIDGWGKKSYADFVENLINQAMRDGSLLDRVFNTYGLLDGQRQFLAMSILQHYGAPTPLLDWTYNLDVALYFATEKVQPPTFKIENNLDDYFSLYVINSKTTEFERVDSKENVKKLFEPIENKAMKPSAYKLLILSDYKKEFSSVKPDVGKYIKKLEDTYLTTIYNQNIIPQEGLFIFNPYPDKAIDDLFLDTDLVGKDEYEASDLFIEDETPQPFIGYNIHKSLAEYVRRKLDKKGINKEFIYPDLAKYVGRIKESVLNGYF